MTPQYFKLTPITEKPEKEGWYDVHFNNGGIGRCHYSNKGWNYRGPERLQITHYYKPLPADTIVISEEKLREVLGKAFASGVDYDNLPKSGLTIINQLIAELKEQQG